MRLPGSNRLGYTHMDAAEAAPPPVDWPGYIESLNPWLYWQLANAPAAGEANLPEAYWKFDDASGGTAADSSGNGNGATWRGTSGSQWGTGIIDGGGVFNGTDNYLTTTLTQSWPSSFSTWVYLTGASPGGLLYGIGLGGAGSAMDFAVNTTNQKLHLRTIAIVDITDSLNALAPGWNQVGFSYDGTTWTLVINGAVDSSGAYSHAWTSGKPIWMGASEYIVPSGFLTAGCKMDESGLWSRILGSADWAYLYALGVGARPTLPSPLALDSASTCQLTPNNASWGGTDAGCTAPNVGFPQPPPNNGSYGTSVQKVAGLLSDSRTAAEPTGSGAIASASWLYTADAPMQGSGWWLAAHIGATTLSNSDLWQIPVELGYYVALQVGNDGSRDFVQLYESYGGAITKWTYTTGTLWPGVHQIIVRSVYGGTHEADLWIDGVGMATQTFSSIITAYNSQGFQAGGTLGSGDVFTLQDLVVMPLGASPGTDMTDPLAETFYTLWSSLLP